MTYSEAIQVRLRHGRRQPVDPQELAEAEAVVAAARATRGPPPTPEEYALAAAVDARRGAAPSEAIVPPPLPAPAVRTASAFSPQYVAPAAPTPAPIARERVEPGPRIGNEPRQSWIWSVDTHQAQQFAEHKPVVLVLQPVLAIDFYPRGA